MDELKRSHASILELASLAGERALILHSPVPEEAELGLGGLDIDCAVQRLDPMWPLRIPAGWRFCGSIHYDLKGWTWILESEGSVIILDTIDDPMGLGRDSFRSDLFLDEEQGLAKPSTRSAYLTAKRLRKGIRAEGEWERIGRLARDDASDYGEKLERLGGPRLAALVSGAALDGRSPNPAAFALARGLLLFRRFGSPVRVLSAMGLGLRRYADRIFRPVGMSVLISGPDGSGKSTLAQALPEACRGIFKRETTFHWRPGILPRAGTFLGTEQADTSTPHAQDPHRRSLSLLVLGYYWLDFLIGRLFWIAPIRIRAGIAVVERGWWDIEVDPRRYRLDVPRTAIRALGTLLPRYDLALSLESSPEVLRSRKAELSVEELTRQMQAWRNVLPAATPQVHLDASRPASELLQESRERILEWLEARAISRVGAGWATLPPEGNTRWWIPRGPAAAAREGLAVHQPMTGRGRLVWKAARLLAAAGGLRLLPRGSAPPRAARERLADHLPPRSTFALAQSNHPGRYVALIVDDRGERLGFAKVATDLAGSEALDREAAAIRTVGVLLRSPLSPPRILSHEPGLLLLDAVGWRPRTRPWLLDDTVAEALGRFFRSGASEGPDGLQGPSHGDLAPWNLLEAPERLVIIDWESAANDRPAFHDVCHYLVQSHALLGTPSSGELLRGFRRGEGWVGLAIRGYAAGAELDPSYAMDALISYLRVTNPGLLPMNDHERDAVTARRLLLSALGG